MTLRSVLPRLSLALAILAAALWLALNRGELDPASVESALRSLGPWGAAAHVVLFALGTVLFVPGALFGLAGGVCSARSGAPSPTSLAPRSGLRRRSWWPATSPRIGCGRRRVRGWIA